MADFLSFYIYIATYYLMTVGPRELLADLLMWNSWCETYTDL